MKDQTGYPIRKARPEDGASIARVQTRTWQSAYAGIFPADKLASLDEGLDLLAERWQSNIRAPERYPAFFVVEDDQGRVIGFAGANSQSNPDYTFDAELNVIYVLPEYHRRGIGRQLMAAVAAELLAAGFSSLMLWVLKDNESSRWFYQRLGGQLAGESEYERWDRTYPVVAYAWENLSSLLK